MEMRTAARAIGRVHRRQDDDCCECCTATDTGDSKGSDDRHGNQCNDELRVDFNTAAGAIMMPSIAG